MMLSMLKGKIHCATVPEANLAYMGSIPIMAYALFTQEEAAANRPTVVLVDEKNRVREVRHLEVHGTRA